MKKLKSNINANSDAFSKNAAEMLKLVEKLEKHLQESRFQGKEKHIEKARKRGKMLARERIEYVLDQDSPFLELLPLAGMEKKRRFWCWWNQCIWNWSSSRKTMHDQL